MKTKNYLLIIFVGLLCLLLATCDSESQTNPAGENVQMINRAQLKALLKKNQSQLVVLNYWASWCANCKPELKILADLQSKYGSKNLRIICVAVDPLDDEMKIALVKFLYLNTGAHFRQFISNEAQVKDIMTVVDDEWLEIVPVTYLITKNGKSLHKYVGSRAIRDLKLEIAKLLDKK